MIRSGPWTCDESCRPGSTGACVRPAHPGREVVQILADRAEGNLLAAIRRSKARAVAGEGHSTPSSSPAPSPTAHADVFELVDSALRRQAARCVHMIEGLRGEGRGGSRAVGTARPIAHPWPRYRRHRQRLSRRRHAISFAGPGVQQSGSRWSAGARWQPANAAMARRLLPNVPAGRRARSRAPTGSSPGSCSSVSCWLCGRHAAGNGRDTGKRPVPASRPASSYWIGGGNRTRQA